MTREKRKKLKSIFRAYKANKKALREDYNFPSVSAVDFSRLAVQTDHSRNGEEEKTIEYIARKEYLFKQVYIVDEVCRWFEVEGHGRERFIKIYLIDGCSWQMAKLKCHVQDRALANWLSDILEKTDWYANWLKFY